MLSQVFHEIEKTILKYLHKNDNVEFQNLRNNLPLNEDQIRRGIEWLKHKELVNVETKTDTLYSLDSNGKKYLKDSLPERKIMNFLHKTGPQTKETLQKEFKGDCDPGIQQSFAQKWITQTVIDGRNFFAHNQSYYPTIIYFPENILQKIADREISEKIFSKSEVEILKNLKRRPKFILSRSVAESKLISLTKAGKSIHLKTDSTEAIDVESKVPEVFVARIHPLKDIIDEIREIFVTLGFSEINGNMTQSSFWNFDALFTPQDHPARELQDTFYLDGISKKDMTSEQIKKVSESHEKNWRYHWESKEAKKMVLRTHTTCVTIKHLAENKPDEARVFSLGRVFRNEKVSYKHLVEFNQIEGVVIGKDANLRNLMGIQKEFYKRIGITKIKFWPTFFPYTEPSLQTMVYNDRLGKWVELFGMGIFRPEVTKPLGITKPVLAWGGGIERIAMLKYDLDDVREFYNNNLNWLRGATKCQ